MPLISFGMKAAQGAPLKVKVDREQEGTLMSFPSDSHTFDWLEIRGDSDRSQLDEVRLMLYRGRRMNLTFEYKETPIEITLPNLSPDDLSYSEGRVIMHYNKPDGGVILRSLDKVSLQKFNWMLRMPLVTAGLIGGVIAFPVLKHVPSALLITTSLSIFVPTYCAYLLRQGLGSKSYIQMGTL
jgi:hypothetical protein